MLYQLAPQYIKWPNEEEARYTWTKIETKYGFPKVIGAIDGTHIKITTPHTHNESYINRKGYHSVQLQVSTTKNVMYNKVQFNKSHDKNIL